MANVAALRKKASEFEQKKQLDRAIAAYREILEIFDSGSEEIVDVGLYNRVGDLLVRQGSTSQAVTLYERAVDLYAEGGFFNNAMALCNKILRTSPGRASVYYKLGKISAAKGFNADAKSNFLEYADRMQKAGDLEEAFRALKEFADLCPDQDDIRLMLAEQLTKAGREGEALDQLQLLYARYTEAGRSSEAQATLGRMRAIDPNAEAKSSQPGFVRKSDDLVFIDLDAPAPRSRRITTGTSTRIVRASTPFRGNEALPSAVPATPRDASAAFASAGPGLAAAESPPDAAPLAASEFAAIDLEAIAEVPSASPPRSSLALGDDLPLIDVEEVDPGHDAAPAPLATEPADPNAPAQLTGQAASVGASEPVSADRGASDNTASVPAAERPRRDPSRYVTRETQELVELVAEALESMTPLGQPAHTGSTEPLAHGREPKVPATPVFANASLASSVTRLVARLAEDAENWALHRQYAEALLDSGRREEGLEQLDVALIGFERANEMEAARSVVNEIIRLNPGSVRHHQKRIEFAFRANDRPRLTTAYLELAESLIRDGLSAKARQVYQRVLELSPDDPRAKEALASFATLAPEAALQPPPRLPTPRTATPSRGGRRYTGSVGTTVPAPPASPAALPAPAGDEYVSLGDWLRAQEGPKSTRMVIDEEEPTGDEEADFADMLKKFKQGVEDNVDAEDHESHYDLGVAYKEMGLLDEAIAEFQRALLGTQHRVRTYEALGQCFLERKQLAVAATILHRALGEPGAPDEQLVGVLYLLGYVSEAMARPAEAKSYYERVFSVDIRFRDVGERLGAIDKARAT